MDLRKVIYRHPSIVNYIRFVYHDIIEGFFNGYYYYILKYLLGVKKTELRELQRKGLSDIKLFNPKTWRRGKGIDKAHRRYYIANYKGHPCFVKIAENDKTLQNEIDVAERIKGNNWTFTPLALLIDTSFLNRRKLLVISYEEGLHRIPDNVSAEELKSYCASFLQIHNKLVNAKLIHADIHCGNLMLNAQNHLVLLDFGISKFLDNTNNVDYIARPGTFYQKTEKGRIYDDAYSFLCMIEKYSESSKILDSEEYNDIKKRVGQAYFEVLL